MCTYIGIFVMVYAIVYFILCDGIGAVRSTISDCYEGNRQKDRSLGLNRSLDDAKNN